MPRVDDRPIHFHIERVRDHALLSFEIRGGDLAPGDLAAVQLPQDLDATAGVVITGRGPVWLYAFLSGRLRSHAWIAVTDANVNRAVVIRSAVTDAPCVGEALMGPGLLRSDVSQASGRGTPRRGAALALLGNPHRGKSVLAAAAAATGCSRAGPAARSAPS